MTATVLHLSIPVIDLDAAREFYEKVLGCRIGRVREDWLDVWFFGMQLTLQQVPVPVPVAVAGDDGDSRHFGVSLVDRASFAELVERLETHGVVWLSPPATAAAEELSGKTSCKLADPSGNVIEFKYYPDPDAIDPR